MSMEGLELVVGKPPSRLSDEERLELASKEVERVGASLAEATRKWEEKKKRKTKATKSEEGKKALAILQAAGISPQEYVEMMKKGDGDG